MDKEIKNINEVQDAERQAELMMQRALSKKQKHIDDAYLKAKQIVEAAEADAKQSLAQSLEATQKELDSTVAHESKETQKLVESIKKRKLPETKIKQLGAQIARAIAGE